MPARLDAFTLDVRDPQRCARFWSGLLGRPVVDDPRGAVALAAPDPSGFRLRFVATDAPRTVPNLFHVELTSDSPGHQDETVARALALGAAHLDVGQLAEEGHVVLADPDGGEFCVLGPGNTFLEGCGFLGDLSGDGTHECGVFWSRALGWPLVWDEGEETAVQSPLGGPKLTWGGTPLNPKPAKNRVHLDLVADTDLATEVARLLDLGARQADIGQGDVPWAVLADPDGNVFCVVPPS